MLHAGPSPRRPKRQRQSSHKILAQQEVEALHQKIKEAKEALKQQKSKFQAINAAKKKSADKRASRARKEQEHRKKLKA